MILSSDFQTVFNNGYTMSQRSTTHTSQYKFFMAPFRSIMLLKASYKRNNYHVLLMTLK